MTRETRFGKHILVSVDEQLNADLKAMAKKRMLSLSALLRTLAAAEVEQQRREFNVE